MEGFKINSRVLLGLLIVVIGSLLFVGSFTDIDTGEIFANGWPIILIIIGLITLTNNSSSKIFSIVLIGIGVFYELKVLDIVFQEISIWQFLWPAMIILAGLWLIFPKRPRISDSTELKNTVIFGGGDVHVVAKDFRGGEVTAIFGGMDIDLRDADMVSNEPAIIDLFVAFGGVDIKVPEGWVVQTKGIPLFGGWDNKHKASRMGYADPAQAEKRLIIKSLILFGGLDIK